MIGDICTVSFGYISAEPLTACWNVIPLITVISIITIGITVYIWKRKK